MTRTFTSLLFLMIAIGLTAFIYWRQLAGDMSTAIILAWLSGTASAFAFAVMTGWRL